jgi:hypothetical protein
MIEAKVGSYHAIKCADSVVRRLSVKDRSRLKDPSAAIAVCLTCGAMNIDYESLASDHKENGELVKCRETHVFALWVEKGLKDFKGTAPIDMMQTQKEIAAAQRELDASQSGLFAAATE